VGRVSRPSDAELARLAGRLRVLTIEQLAIAGLTPEAVEYRVAQGRLQRLWTGVYLVGPTAPRPLSLAKGAVASCKQPSWVYGRWGIYVHGFGEVPELPIEVIVRRGSRQGRPGKVRVRRCEHAETTTRWGIPVVTPAWAIIGTAETATLHELEALIAQAQVKGLVTEQELRAAATRRGTRKILQILTDAPGVTLSEAERILRRLLRQAGLPQPITNYAIGRYRADFAWPDHQLVVEYDGFDTHAHRKSFHHDRRRNAELTARGWSVMQVTADQLRDEPLALIARIAEALARRATFTGSR
jgi:very-short-patch-repair endonuclease